MPTSIYYFRSMPKGSVPLRDHIHHEFGEYVKEQRRVNHAYFDIKLNLSIDFVRLSVFSSRKSMQLIEQELIKGSVKPVSRIKNPWLDYDTIDTYYIEHADLGYTASIMKSKKMYFLPDLITVHDPDVKIINHIEPLLNQLKYYHVKELELTFDFENDDREYIKQFIKNHFIINWRGKKFYHPSGTHYFNNIRFCKGKGSRLYDKIIKKDKDKDNNFIRLEMLLKRPILLKHNIHRISDIDSLKPEKLSRYFNFKELNFSKCKKRFKEKGKELPEIARKFNEYKNQVSAGNLYDLNRTILKKYKNYPSDGFLTHHSFNSHFLSQIQGKSFLKRDSVKVSTGQMDGKTFDKETMTLL